MLEDKLTVVILHILLQYCHLCLDITIRCERSLLGAKRGEKFILSCMETYGFCLINYSFCVENYCTFVSFSVVSEIPAIQFHFISAARHKIPLITACNSISRIIIPDSILKVVKTENLSFSGCSNATVLTIVTGGGV